MSSQTSSPREAQLEAILGPAIRTAVQAAAETCTQAQLGGEATTLTQALQPVVDALHEVLQAVRRTEEKLDQLALEMKDSKSDGAATYNATAAAHNQAQLARGTPKALLMPLKNPEGKQPPPGVFPRTVEDWNKLMRPASYYSARDEHSYPNRNVRIVQLLHFYGAKMCEEVGVQLPEVELPGRGEYTNVEAREEFERRASALRAVLHL